MNFVTDFSYIDELLGKGVKYAVFDVDNTITKSNIVQFYLFVKRKKIKSRLFWMLFILYCIAAAPFYLLLDVTSRDLFNKWFVLRKFQGYSYEDLEQSAAEFFDRKLRKQFIQYTHDVIFYLKEKGIQVVLLSTNFDLLVKQYGNYFDVPYVCLYIQKRGKGVTIDFSHLKGFKDNAIRKFHPAETLAFGDSKYDLPALSYVDHPFIVANKPKKWMEDLKKEPIFIKTDVKT